ncbi:oxidoreductase family protein [Phyllosticta citricarpa]|uniref:Oxidoreductase family protein n=2 Tax=Phyllosticta TaxID=121621 RepID=A0ABR1LR43_9PEZI
MPHSADTTNAVASDASPVHAPSSACSSLPIRPKKLLSSSPSPPRILIIGAGSRGRAYAKAISRHTACVIAAVAEPIEYKRKKFARDLIEPPQRESHQEEEEVQHRHRQQFSHWRDFVAWEEHRRARVEAGEQGWAQGVDAAFVCVLDEMHREVVEGLAPLGLHVMCEKPLATTLEDCIKIYEAMLGSDHKPRWQERVFSIGHVLRYSPHNMLLRKLVREDRVVGDILSVEHTEPVGWWHFSHSYVRGNWRRESSTAPSLLTKSCHDIDFILWMMSEPAKEHEKIHKPAFVTSTGKLNYFRKARKPPAAGSATNCQSCPLERDCTFSATNIYVERHLKNGNAKWPVKIVNPENEDVLINEGIEAAEKQLLKDLAEDYTPDAPDDEIRKRPWFGRCVWESDNDVCDDQCVTITWEDDSAANQFAKTAQFHMVAFTEKICERRGRIYGTEGEIEYDSTTIKVHNFATGKTVTHHPELRGGGHGGGDDGLATQFVQAVAAVKDGRLEAEAAQRSFIGCTLEEVLQSHAMVFAAEEARKQKKVVDWPSWWQENVEARLGKKAANGHA